MTFVNGLIQSMRLPCSPQNASGSAIEAALQHYRLAAGDVRSPVAPLAAYRVAWVRMAMGQDREAIGEFMRALGEALVIVLVVSFLSIGWRSGLVIAIAIPLVLAATFALMYELGIDLQRMSLGAVIIALGMMVDNSIVIADGIVVRMGKGVSKQEAAIQRAKCGPDIGNFAVSQDIDSSAERPDP